MQTNGDREVVIWHILGPALTGSIETVQPHIEPINYSLIGSMWGCMVSMGPVRAGPKMCRNATSRSAFVCIVFSATEIAVFFRKIERQSVKYHVLHTEKVSRIGNRLPKDCHCGPFWGSPPTLPC